MSMGSEAATRSAYLDQLIVELAVLECVSAGVVPRTLADSPILSSALRRAGIDLPPGAEGQILQRVAQHLLEQMRGDTDVPAPDVPHVALRGEPHGHWLGRNTGGSKPPETRTCHCGMRTPGASSGENGVTPRRDEEQGETAAVIHRDPSGVGRLDAPEDGDSSDPAHAVSAEPLLQPDLARTEPPRGAACQNPADDPPRWPLAGETVPERRVGVEIPDANARECQDSLDTSSAEQRESWRALATGRD